MDHHDLPTTILHWNYRGFTEFPFHSLLGDEGEITDIYLKENLISRIPREIGKLVHLESLYLSGNDISELPQEICMLRCLKCLDLSGNRLRKIPEGIADVKGLKFLILDENELSELPLRLAELRSLRYLSVCDNQLRWLPQRPVFNYHHCEFRFWRNIDLKTIPYSLWYHMFRGQQTRSLDIGCLSIPKQQYVSKNSGCQLKLIQDSRRWTFNMDFPPSHQVIFERHSPSPPSLYEICRRVIYQTISETARKLSAETFSVYSEKVHDNNNITNLDNIFQEFNIDSGSCDLNGNSLRRSSTSSNSPTVNKNRKSSYVPADLIEQYFSFLPSFLKEELTVGPVSRCENVGCKKPVFDYAFYEFCLGYLILIDNTEEIVLSAAFCSRTCANEWRKGKSDLLSWTLIKRG